MLVHGLGMSGRYMMPAARLPASYGNVHVTDLPGFGKSANPGRPFSIYFLADALDVWLEARQITAPVLIGTSRGDQVIADYASRYPQRLKCAVLVALTIDPQARRISLQVLRLLRDLPREPLGLYWFGIGDYFKASGVTIIQTLRFAVMHPIAEALRIIRRPVLLLRGGRDPIIPQSWMEEAARLMPGAELVVFRRTAHAVNFSNPGALVNARLKFLAQHCGPE